MIEGNFFETLLITSQGLADHRWELVVSAPLVVFEMVSRHLATRPVMQQDKQRLEAQRAGLQFVLFGCLKKSSCPL